MKTIKIFLASSEELKNDRVSFGNFIRELDKRYRERGIYINLYTWEGADGAYNGRRKQDEYNDNVRDSDMLVALFYIKAGGFTQEEFHEAVNSFEKTGKPKVYVYFRQLEDESKITKELKIFKKELEGQDSRGHFAFRYNNDDSLHLDFVMQLLLLDKIKNDELNVEDGQVMLNGMVIAQMDSLQFATDNKENQKLNEDLKRIESELNEIRQALAQNPNIDFIKKQYEHKNEEYKQKKEELEKHQKSLLNTAIRITNYQKDCISEETKRAIEAFNSGDAPRADFILDEAENNTQRIKEQLHAAKEVAYQKIDQLLLHASFKINNTTIHIDERIKQTRSKYEEAISLAKESGYDELKYADLIEKFVDFLQNYHDYMGALTYGLKYVLIVKKKYGEKDINTAIAYTKLGRLYVLNDFYDQAIDILNDAMAIFDDLKEPGSLLIAEVYNNIGNAYDGKKELEAALEWHQKSLAIRIKHGEYTLDTARSYNNIGGALGKMGRTKDALEYLQKSIKIREEILDKNDKYLANAYQHVTAAYRVLGEKDKVIEYLEKACVIFENIYGGEGCLKIYNEIGYEYIGINDYYSAFKWFEKSAILGDTEAESNLGWMYGKGDGVVKDFQKAYYWSLKAAEKGNSLAQNSLGVLYSNGDGVKQDYKEAVKWFTKSAEQGYSMAQKNLGLHYEYGEGVVQDFCKAHEWYQKAANQGLPQAQFKMGNMYEFGKGVIEDKSTAFTWYEKSAKQGLASAQYKLGRFYACGLGTGKNYEKALKWYSKAAKQGDSLSQYYLGIIYENGYGVAIDYKKSIEWYTKSAKQGYFGAQFNLGVMYQKGNGVKQNISKSIELYSKSAEQGYVKAQYNLGVLYRDGAGVAQDLTKAVEFFQLAADQGFPNAQYNLGVLYRDGAGVAQDLTKAVEFFQLAADQGFPNAQYNLGLLYCEGIGVAQDLTKAVEFFRMAAEQDFEFSYNELAWALHLVDQPDEALPWAERAVMSFPEEDMPIDTLATIYQDLGRYNEAFKQFELCIKLQKEHSKPIELIHETEKKVAVLKELMDNGRVPEQ